MSSQSTLPNLLPPPPLQTSITGATGVVSQAWAMWFQKLTNRVGGPIATNLTEVNASVTAVQAEADTLTTEVNTLQATTATQGAAIVATQGTVAAQGAEVAALQAIVDPGISVVINTAPLTLVGFPGSMTFVHGILTAQTQAT